VKLLVVDDHAMVRQGLCALLARALPEAELAEAADSAQALALAASAPDLDVVFLDLAMPGMDGLAALAELTRLRPDLPVIVLTAAEDAELARQAFDAGALGYVPKSATGDVLLAALNLVLQGEVFVPSLMVRPGAAGAAAQEPGAVGLTSRQAEVLRHLAEGVSNREIAERLGVSEKTVKGHMTGLLRALSAEGRQEAVRAARAGGLLSRS
jgi:DNA-binding NarL/FixJ family response regulator